MQFSTAVYTAACIDVNKKLYARQAAAFRSPIEFKVNNFAKALISSQKTLVINSPGDYF